jgi:hypothetical protein
MRDDDIDHLYQIPLDEFTAARNALAKRSGADAPAIRRLQKPTAPAWAVNQLFWHRRRTFDQLASAAERQRDAHARRFSGEGAGVEKAEAAHAAAVAAAVRDATSLLGGAGDDVTPATVAAITETLRAFPWAERAGRLARPARPQGFEALVGLLPKGGAPAKRLAKVVAFKRAEEQRAPGATRAERAAQEAENRRRAIGELKTELGKARAAERAAMATLARARRPVERAETRRKALTDELERATAALQTLRDAVQREVRAASAATANRERLEARILELEKL